MTDEKQKLKIIFAPGAFDGFEGTQEELDALMKELTYLVESGEILKMEHNVDLDTLEEENPDLFKALINLDQDKSKLLN